MTKRILEQGKDYTKTGILWRKRYSLLQDLNTRTKIIPPDLISVVSHDDYNKSVGVLRNDGLLVLEKNYTVDGATKAIDTASFRRGFFIHDWGCSAVENNSLPVEYRKMFDDLLYDIVIEDGMPKPRAEYVKYFVTTYGKLKYFETFN